MTERLQAKKMVLIILSSSNPQTSIFISELHRDRSGAKILETWYLLPPSPLKQCCNNDSMPPGLLKWSTQHCLWGEGGGMINKKLKFMSKNLSK